MNNGFSGKPSTLEHLEEVLAELMDAWGLLQAALAGVSMGAGIALGYTLGHLERVRKLVLIGAKSPSQCCWCTAAGMPACQ